MSTDRAKTALQLFEQALTVTPTERSDWVRLACGHDVDLAADVESLLAAHGSAGGFLESGPIALPAIGDFECSPELHIAAGATLGDFVIERQIGAGGMGLVYRARQISVNRAVALKVLPPHLRHSQSARTRFQREVEAAARLRHPNIVAVYTAGEDDYAVYFAMELIEGPPLSDLIDELRRHPPPELHACETPRKNAAAAGANTLASARDATTQSLGTGVARSGRSERNPASQELLLGNGDRGYFASIAELVANVATGLEYAHSMQVVHRDVKPSNLLMSPDGRVHISDFGLARVAHEPGLTRTGEVMGTPFYMAPEQISPAAGSVDARSDVYALGATLYELLALRPPFCGDQREQVLLQITRDEPASPQALNRLVPRDLDTICLKAIEKKPARRYQSAGEMAEDLQRFVEGRPILARRATCAQHALRWVQRNLAMATAAGVMGVLAVVALFFAYRTHLYQARWTEAEYTRLFETAQMAAVEGDLDRAAQAIDDAQEFGAPANQLLLLRGQLDLQSGRFQAACNKLERAVSQFPDSVAAHALLANAYDANELHAKSAAELALLATLTPATLQDYILLGKAQFQTDFSTAIKTLDQAIAVDKTSVHARLARGSALVERAMDTGEAEHAERALDDLRIASELLEPNAYLLGNVLQAHLVASTAYELTGDRTRQTEHLQRAAQVADALEEFPDAFASQRWRAFYYDFIGDDQRAIEVWRTAKDQQIAYLVLALLRQDEVGDALALCDERLARFPTARFTQFFKSLLLSTQTETPEKCLASFALHGQETLDAVNAHRFGYVIDCLTGNTSKAKQDCQLSAPALRHGAARDPWRLHLLAYTGGEIDEGALLEHSSKSRISLCQAHFFIGVTHLAAGERMTAREHFRASADLKILGHLEDHLSRAYLAQLERSASWPAWIAE